MALSDEELLDLLSGALKELQEIADLEAQQAKNRANGIPGVDVDWSARKERLIDVHREIIDELDRRYATHA